MRERLYSPPFESCSKRIIAIRRMKHAIDDQQLIAHCLAAQLNACAGGFHQRNPVRTGDQHDRG